MKNYTSISEMRKDALEILRKQELDTYLEGGAGTGQTVINNRQAFNEVRVVPRLLGQEESGFGTDKDFFIAPTAWHKLFHQEGESATLRAAIKSNTLMIVSSFSQTSWQDLTGGKKWYQMLLIDDYELMGEYAHAAKEAGCSALILTIDAPNGCTACRTQGDKPDRVAVADMPLLPKKRGDYFDSLRHYIEESMKGPFHHGYYEKLISKLSQVLPVYLKGIMSPEDAVETQKIGATGIYVSNHGGRQYDRGMSTLEATRKIRDQIGGDFPLIMDGGVRNGQDIAIARKAGADMVGIGRSIHYGLTLNGQNGVSRVLEILKDEYDTATMLGM